MIDSVCLQDSFLCVDDDDVVDERRDFSESDAISPSTDTLKKINKNKVKNKL